MQRLVILRHATAAAQGDEPGDRARPLTTRGLREAAAAGDWLKENDVRPEIVICSPSLRTRETWDMVAERLPNAEAEYWDDLYLGAPDAYLEAIETAGRGAGSILVIGHNPTCASLAIEFTGRRTPSAPRFEGHFPPAALCVAERSGDDWRMIDFVLPADAKAPR